MHRTVQPRDDRVVTLAEAEVLRQRQNGHAGIAKIGLRQPLAAAVRASVIDHIQGKIRGGGMLQNAAHRGAYLLIIAVRHNTGADFRHNYFSNASRWVRSYGVS